MTVRTISYAQNAEDIVLNRAFGAQRTGFYVDVGANEPTHDSVTRLFYDRGWHGINIEPQTDCIERLRAERPRDVNLNLGVGATEGTLDFFVVPGAPAMSTFSASHADQVRGMGYTTKRHEVAVRTLDSVLAEYAAEQTIDFLKVDVEGLEEEVLGTIDWQRWRPRVVVVESYPVVDAWEKRLLDAGYRRTLWDGINLFFVRAEDDERLGEKLASPATWVLDRYDPWLYVEQLEKSRSGNEPLLTYFLTQELGSRAPAGTDVGPAAAALAHALQRRPDVAQAFGTPPDTDVARLLGWAAAVPEGTDEPHTGELVQWAPLYRSLAVRSPSGAGGRGGGLPAAAGRVALRTARGAARRLRDRTR